MPGYSVQIRAQPLVLRVILRFMQFVGICLLIAAYSRLSPTIAYVRDALRMRQWEEVPATVIEAKIGPAGDGNKNPQVFAKYRYEYGGVAYEGSRVDVTNGPNFVGRFQKEMANELQQHVKDGTPAVCFVNPAQPDETVLYPQLRYTELALEVALLFVLTLAGGLFLGCATYVLRRNARLAERQNAYPEQPWLWRPDWADKRIRNSGYDDSPVFVGIAVVYLFLVLPLALMVLLEWDWQIVSWPGIGLMLVGWGFFNFARQRVWGGRRYKRAVFEMASDCGLIGGPLAGVVTIPARMPSDMIWRVSLECLAHQTGGDGPAFARVWHDEVLVQKTLATDEPNKTAIPVYLAIPYTCRPSEPTDNDPIRWRLKVGPDADNLEQGAAFDVPVFKTEESSPDFKADPTILQAYEVPVDAEAIVRRFGRMEPLPDGGERWRFSIFSWLVLWGVLGIAAVCGAAIAAIFYFHWHFAWSILPGIFAVMMAFGLLEMLFWGSSLEIRRDGVRVASGYAGLRKTHDLPYHEIIDIEKTAEFPGNQKQYFRLELRAEGGLHLQIIKRLENRREAEAVEPWLTNKIDAKLIQWCERSLGEIPQVVLNAFVKDLRVGGSAGSRALLVALGIPPDGRPTVFGVAVAPSRAEEHWQMFLESLKRRGLRGVQRIIVGKNAGADHVFQTCFPDTALERTAFQFRFMQVLLGNLKDETAGQAQEIRKALEGVFHAPGHTEAEALLRLTAEKYAKTEPELASFLNARGMDALIAFAFPLAPLQRLRFIDLLGPLYLAIEKRNLLREPFPNENSLLRLATAALRSTDPADQEKS